MTYTDIGNNLEQAVHSFQSFGADEQLALLWFIYTDIGSELTPKGGPDTSGFEIADALVRQLQEQSREEQLEAQRAIVAARADHPMAHTYGNLNSSNRLAFWYLLAKGMEDASIVPVPDTYELPSEAQDFLAAVCNLDFEQQVTFMRNVVSLIGPDAIEGAVVS